MARSLYKFPYVHRSLWLKSVKARKRIVYSSDLSSKIMPHDTPIANNMYF
jgi:hypothetical protein